MKGEPIPVEPERVAEDASPAVAPLGTDVPRGWLGWLCANIVLPLTPALIGASIRLIHDGLSIDIFEPGELAFSLAMFCLLGAVSARRVTDREYRDTAFTAFTVGVAFFMSMFAISVLIAAQLSSAMEAAIGDLTAGFSQTPAPSSAVIDELARVNERLHTRKTFKTILLFVGTMGFLFVGTALVFRDKYRLGDE